MARRHVRIEPGPARFGHSHLRSGLLRKQADERVVQVRLVDRFAQISAEELAVADDLAAPQRAEQHQRQGSPALPYLARKRQTIHFWHVHVQDRDVESLRLFEPAQRFEG